MIWSLILMEQDGDFTGSAHSPEGREHVEPEEWLEICRPALDFLNWRGGGTFLVIHPEQEGES